jgi:hypothetical protein
VREAELLRIGDLVGRDDERAERAERIEALATDPLAVPELDVPGGHVVGHRVAEHVIEGLLDRYPRGSTADHGRELDLPVDAVGNCAVNQDRLAVANDARAELREHQRPCGTGQTGLADVVEVVQTDRDDLRRAEWREQLHSGERRSFGGQPAAAGDEVHEVRAIGPLERIPAAVVLDDPARHARYRPCSDLHARSRRSRPIPRLGRCGPSTPPLPPAARSACAPKAGFRARTFSAIRAHR